MPLRRGPATRLAARLRPSSPSDASERVAGGGASEVEGEDAESPLTLSLTAGKPSPHWQIYRLELGLAVFGGFAMLLLYYQH